MLTILIIVFLGVIVALIRNRNKIKRGVRESNIDRLFRILFYVIWASGISIIFASIFSLFAGFHHATFKEEKELIILKDNRETAGDFFLGFGSLKDRRYYEFYFKSENGKIEYGRLPIDTPIYEKEKLAQPILKIFTVERKFKKSWYKWIAINDKPEEKYEIWIPKGVIKNDFFLDLK